MKIRVLIISTLAFLFQLQLFAEVIYASPWAPWEDGCGTGQVNTALGCVSSSATPGSGSFFESLLKIAIGLGGGLALILMLYGVFIVTTSAGIPDKLKEGSEIITSAISGLIFVILSVVLLNFIGINVLGLPGLS